MRPSSEVRVFLLAMRVILLLMICIADITLLFPILVMPAIFRTG